MFYFRCSDPVRSLSSLSSSVIVNSILLISVLTLSSPVLAAEQVIVLAPGADHVDIKLADSAVVSDLEHPLHGDLVPILGGYRYLPSGDFWTIGRDVVIIHDSNSGVTHRYRLVAGRNAGNSAIFSMAPDQNPNPSGHSGVWWIKEYLGNPIEVIQPGAFSPVAHRIRGSAQNLNPSLSTDNPVGNDQGPNASPSTVEMTVVVDDPGPEWIFTEDAVSLFRIVRDASNVLELQLKEMGLGFGLQLASPQSPSEPLVSLPSGQNFIRIERHLDASPQPGAMLFLNDVLVAEVDMAVPSDSEEIYDIGMFSTETSTLGLDVVVEAPMIRLGQANESPLDREAFSQFPETGSSFGFNFYANNWLTVLPGAMSTSPQTLPGNGQQLDIDLGALGVGQSSFMSQVAPNANGAVLDPQGSALRFWFDSSAVSLQQGTQFTMASICGATPPCGAAHVRLRHTAYGYDILVTSLMEDGSMLPLSIPAVTPGPHTLELRVRNAAAPGLANGWLEVWLDGELERREHRLANHDQQPSSYRFGVIGDQANSTGILSLDDIEAWRFD